MGFRVTGIDPSEQSLATARQHAQSKGLSIQYQQGTGESIPFADQHPTRLSTVAMFWSTFATCRK